MDLKSNTSPVVTDPVPMTQSRLGVHSALMPYTPAGPTFSPTLFLTIPRKKPGILDDVRSNAWLDAMKSSSPTYRKKSKDSTTEPASNESDLAYRIWMVMLFVIWYCPCYAWILLPEEYKRSVVIFFVLLQLKYPSALSSFEQITNYAKGKRVALFLDYDGTLSPIVDDPDRAFMSSAVGILTF